MIKQFFQLHLAKVVFVIVIGFTNHPFLHAQTQEPYAGIISIPGTIEAENFDVGGEGISYHDADVSNRAGANYRPDEGVDIGIKPGGGYSIGYTTNGEWLEYTINVTKSSAYDFEIIYSSGRDGALLGIDIDNYSLVQNHVLEKTTSYDVYVSDYILSLPLTAGIHVLKIKVDHAGFNLDKIIIVGQQEPFNGVIALPGTIEAENYDLGGEGTAYHDNDPTNSGRSYRNNDVDIVGDSINGYAITSTIGGEWLEYSVQILQSAYYDFDFIYSSDANLQDAVISAKIPALENTLFKNVVLTYTGEINTIDTLTTSRIFLPKGEFILRINIEYGGAIIDKFIVKPYDTSNEPNTKSSRPWIWTSAEDKVTILNNITNYTWAANLKNNLKSRVDATKNAHKINPASLINSIAAIPGARSSHCNMLDKAVEAGILYFLYDDEDYAQLAADIVNHYAVALGVPDYKDCDFLTGEDFFIESRTVFTRFAIAYDFIYNFVLEPTTTVYDKASGSRLIFNHAKAQQTCKNFADLVLKNGGLGSNHSILEGGGALYNIMCISDSSARESYFARYWNGDTRHDAFNGYTLKKFSAEQGLWPESMSYGKGPHSGVLKYMEIIDRFKPELNVVSKNLRILYGAFTYEDFKYPNNLEIAAYGDSRRNNIETEELYRFVLKTATRKNFSILSEKASTLLKQRYKTTGYAPSIKTNYLDWDEPIKLLWGVNFDLSGNIPDYEYNTTADITHAGVVLQRNYNCADTKTNGLVYYTGGAHYVHSHLSGLDMELYGSGYVMGGVAADMPSPNDRSLDINRHYYRIYAGHNTVIVNGKSQGRGSGSWKSDGLLWQNTTVLQASEPKPLAEPISENFAFSTQFLDDNVNNCDQQRTTSIIRTSPTTGYYIDFFRSKSNGTNNFHDYVYHNIGDEIQMTNTDNNVLPQTAAPNRYKSINVVYNGATVKFPGWHYFENVKTSAETAETVKTRFKMNTSTPRYMHVLMPGGLNREYSSAQAPPILEAAAGYDKKNAQVLSIRQTGEAWTRPFIAAYEPSRNANASIQSIDYIFDGDNVVGAKVVSAIQQTIITDYIIAQDKPNAVYENTNKEIRFVGRFAIVRKEETNDKTKVDMYIGEGKSLTFKGVELTGDAQNKAYSTYEIDSLYNSKQKLNAEYDISISPNPTKGELTLRCNKQLTGNYAIYKMNGQIIKKGPLKNNKTISIRDKIAGIYLLKIDTNNGTFCKKISLYN